MSYAIPYAQRSEERKEKNKAHNRKWYAENRDAQRLRMLVAYRRRKLGIKAHPKPKWDYKATRERENAYFKSERGRAIKKAWRDSASGKASLAACAAKRRERARAYRREYYKKNRERILVKCREWVLHNRDKVRLASANGQIRRKARIRGRMGVVTKGWEIVLRADPCSYCTSSVGGSIDHVVAVAAGGMHDDKNLVGSCFPCNYTKKQKPLLQFLLEGPR